MCRVLIKGVLASMFAVITSPANMLSKSELKDLRFLHQKKYRESQGRFLVEGDKMVREALQSSAEVLSVYCVSDWPGISLSQSRGINPTVVNTKELGQLCELRNPNQTAALVSLPSEQASAAVSLSTGWNIYLDRVRDPGNLGTILRIADWYGIAQVICSPESVDPYNQKCVQSSMGAIFRTRLSIMDESQLIETAHDANLTLYATLLAGESIHTRAAGTSGVLMMGNEAQGLSQPLQDAAQVAITIPGGGGAESLNLAIATGIICDWAMRG